MKSSEIKTVIADLQEKRDALYTQLDDLLKAAFAELPVQAEKWIKTELERRVEDHPQTINELGIEKLGVLKSRVKSLITSLPEITKQQIGNPNDWPHHQPHTEQHQAQKFFNNVFRNVVSQVGVILNSFELLSEPDGRARSWERYGSDGFRYSIGTEGVSSPSASQYFQFYNHFTVIESDLAKRKEAYTKQKAKELWEEA
jgi:hypothetical protein